MQRPPHKALIAHSTPGGYVPPVLGAGTVKAASRRAANAATATANHAARQQQQQQRQADRLAAQRARQLARLQNRGISLDGGSMSTSTASSLSGSQPAGSGGGGSDLPGYALAPGVTAPGTGAIADPNAATGPGGPVDAGTSSSGGPTFFHKHPVLKWTLIVGGGGLAVVTLYGYAKYRAIVAPYRAGKALWAAGKGFIKAVA